MRKFFLPLLGLLLAPTLSGAENIPSEHARYPDVAVIGYMGTSASDGMHFRNAGIPTLATPSVFMQPEDNFAHGLNERMPKKAFYDALDHWSIILKELAGGSD